MKKKVLSVLLSAAIAVSLTACGSSSGSDSSASESSSAEEAASASTAAAGSSGTDESVASGDYGDVTVAIILKTLSSEYWSYVEAGIEAAEADLGCTVELNGPPSETSYDEQQNMIETTVARADIDAIAIAPLQADLVATKVQNATVPVLAVDTRIEGADNVLSFVGTDHETAAYEGASELCSQFENAKVAFIEGVQGDTTNTARFTGFENGTLDAGGEVLTVQYCNAADDQARNCMDAILSMYPDEGDLDIVFVCNDSCAQAAAKALKELDRSDILICGYDGISSGVQSIIDGEMAASVAQDPYNIGYQTVVAACMAAKGEAIESEIDTGSRLITAENAVEYLATLEKYLEG